MGRKTFSADFQLMFRLLKLFLFIGFIVTLVILFAFLSLTIGDIFASLLAFLPTGWALLQVHILPRFIYCIYLPLYPPLLSLKKEWPKEASETLEKNEMQWESLYAY